MEKITKIWLTDSEIWIQTEDGRTASESFADYPRLRYATRVQRENYTYDAFGIHWEALEEDRRLFYVGMTRAKDELLLVRFTPQDDAAELRSQFCSRVFSLQQMLRNRANK